MKAMIKENTNIQGWSIFSHIERSHAAIVMRDPLEMVIRGARYQIVPDMNVLGQVVHMFLFEGWCYKARGAIRHQTLLSFELAERQTNDHSVVGHIRDLSILNRAVKMDENTALSALRCAAKLIENISSNASFDAVHELRRFGLIERDVVVSQCESSEVIKNTDTSF